MLLLTLVLFINTIITKKWNKLRTIVDHRIKCTIVKFLYPNCVLNMPKTKLMHSMDITILILLLWLNIMYCTIQACFSTFFDLKWSLLKLKIPFSLCICLLTFEKNIYYDWWTHTSCSPVISINRTLFLQVNNYHDFHLWWSVISHPAYLLHHKIWDEIHKIMPLVNFCSSTYIKSKVPMAIHCRLHLYVQPTYYTTVQSSYYEKCRLFFCYEWKPSCVTTKLTVLMPAKMDGTQKRRLVRGHP